MEWNGERSLTAVRSTIVVGAKGVTGEDGRCTEGMSEGEDVGGDVGIGRRVDVQRRSSAALKHQTFKSTIRRPQVELETYPFGVVVGDEDVSVRGVGPFWEDGY